ncbi:hypothetical protein DYB32_010685 [Aphanomyces invadans]|uniref:Uncharacterized protein n=1 Tax=Aphanomyces invadans TaxID=157072 RepID=A0A418AFG6_9STRA|nr:hypothetical protein DYB32_010685 [Aphanomyces invadans]
MYFCFCFIEDSASHQSQFAAHEAPKFKGSTKAERRQFMREYNQYLEQVAALQTTTTTPLVMLVSVCIDHYTKKRVAVWELDKMVEEATEADWIASMHLGFDVLPSDLDAIKARLRGALKFDLSIVDVDSRLDNQEWVLKEEGKMMVAVIVDAIKPAGLQDAVKEQIAMPRNKALKSDVIKFVRWLREYATTYQMFVKLRPDDITPLKANKPPTGAARASGGSPKSGQPPALEAPELLRANRSGAGRGGSAGGKTHGNSPNHGPEADGDRAQAARQVDAIEAPAAKVKLNSVVFQTSYGPLVLRGLDLWVDEAVTDKAELLVGRPVMNFLGYSADGVLAAARNQAAVWYQDTLEPPPPTAMATVHRLMQAGLDDGGNDEDGMQCATHLPGAVGPKEQAAREAAVWDVLATKLARAKDEGLSAPSLLQLEQLLRSNFDVFRLEMGGDRLR